VALREHFSLPFVFAQFIVVGLFLDAKTPQKEVKTDDHFHKELPNLKRILSVLTLAFTFFFAITWQSAQFVVLLQSLVVFALAVIKLVDPNKVQSHF